MLRLYYEPAATTCRPIMLFVDEAGIALDYVHVDLFGGEHAQPGFAAINPNQAVPVLDHDGFRLTECSAILKYLAEISRAPAYPTAVQARARVNQMMDWFLSGFSQDYCYGVVYAQVLPEYRRAEPVHGAELARFHARAARRLAVLDQWIGGRAFLCGETITLADYLGGAFVSLGELIEFDLSPYPNVSRWLGGLQRRPSWDAVHSGFFGWRSAARQALRQHA